MNRDNKYWTMIHYQRAMYKRLGYKKTRVRQIIKSREKDEKQGNFFKQTLDRIVSETKVKKVLEMLGDD